MLSCAHINSLCPAVIHRYSVTQKASSLVASSAVHAPTEAQRSTRKLSPREKRIAKQIEKSKATQSKPARPTNDRQSQSKPNSTRQQNQATRPASLSLHQLDASELTAQALGQATAARRIHIALQQLQHNTDAVHHPDVHASPDAAHAAKRQRLQHQQSQVHQQLASIAEASHQRITELSRQQLADITWAAAHHSRQLAAPLHAAMDVPFEVLPCCMPSIQLQDFMSEVALQRDIIYLDNGTRAVPEARLTAWQSDTGATFCYSGKEMLPPPGGMTPQVAAVRDALADLTGIHYDSVLINYYEDGKCGMRYHVDPLYGCWTPHSAVVSVGSTRQFIFREAGDHGVRWHYRVSNGDVVFMYGDCQDRLQHCVKVEAAAERAGPRMSLVFKQRLPGTL